MYWGFPNSHDDFHKTTSALRRGTQYNAIWDVSRTRSGKHMSNGLIDLEDAMYALYMRFYPNGKAVRIGFDALHAHTTTLISRFPQATADLLANSAYRLNRRVFSSPYTVKAHTPRSVIHLRPARSYLYTFTSHQDLALAFHTVITSNPDTHILSQLACLTFQTVNLPSLSIDSDALRALTNSVVISTHEQRSSHVQTPSPAGFMQFFYKQ